ncbi:unnamed protein product, partial [Heterotrigona itama]
FSLKKILACSTSFNNFLLVHIFIINTKQFVIFVLIYSVVIYHLTNILRKFGSRKMFVVLSRGFVKFIFTAWILIYSMLPIILRFVLK